MIEIKNLTKIYDFDHKVVDDLTMSIPKGIVFGFLGPNGAGKTTTIKILVGLNEPDKGNVTLDGKSSSDTSTRELIGFMPEEPHFYDELTGIEFLELSARLFDKSKNKSRSDLEGLLKKSGIHHAKDKKIRNYSKGMKQRLGFAQSIVNDPEYIFLDEPLEGLDPIGRREMKKMLDELKKTDKTIFFNSHILSDVESMCDKIGIIHQGKLVYSGPVKDFTNSLSLEDRFVEEINKIDANYQNE